MPFFLSAGVAVLLLCGNKKNQLSQQRGGGTLWAIIMFCRRRLCTMVGPMMFTSFSLSSFGAKKAKCDDHTEGKMSITSCDVEKINWEEKGQNCGFCKYFLSGPCAEPFKYWSTCVDLAKSKDVDFTTACSDYTEILFRCQRNHADENDTNGSDDDDESPKTDDVDSRSDDGNMEGVDESAGQISDAPQEESTVKGVDESTGQILDVPKEESTERKIGLKNSPKTDEMDSIEA